MFFNEKRPGYLDGSETTPRDSDNRDSAAPRIEVIKHEIKFPESPSMIRLEDYDPEILQQLYQPDARRLNLGEELYVFLGQPPGVEMQDHQKINFPVDPHIFIADWINFIQLRHPRNPQLREYRISNIPVIMAHGVRVLGSPEPWQFLNGQPVVRTVRAFNEKSQGLGLPRIYVVLSCNTKVEPDRSGLGLTTADFRPDERIGQVIAGPALAEDIERRNGKIVGSLRANNLVNIGQLYDMAKIRVHSEPSQTQ